MTRAALIALLLLTACGVDGAPTNETEPGVTIGGTVEAGIAIDGGT